ncbi:hypothetical protein [Neorhizobium sp. LjRoot104]|uniref:hypothetical protein n=1 Tax=Neorhizobium sp. LjRoot104 TaxID=3342254 RepID=UPI003ED0E5C3
MIRLTPFLWTGPVGSGHPIGFVFSQKEWIIMATEPLDTLKLIAKRLARAQQLPHIAALEIVACEAGKSNWRSLAEAYKQGWRPSPQKLESLKANIGTQSVPGARKNASPHGLGEGLVFSRCVPDHVEPLEADEIHGELDGHTFYLVGSEYSVAFGSQGWEIELEQAPSAKPKVRRVGLRAKSATALDPVFIERATKLLTIRARRMHAEIASDWPRRSTQPDHKGRALHPLGRGLSAEWHCLHCDGTHDGNTMAKNLWHCPDCGASPIDIFREPFFDVIEPSV